MNAGREGQSVTHHSHGRHGPNNTVARDPLTNHLQLLIFILFFSFLFLGHEIRKLLAGMKNGRKIWREERKKR